MADDELRQYRQLCAASRGLPERSPAHAAVNPNSMMRAAWIRLPNAVERPFVPLPIRTSWGLAVIGLSGKCESRSCLPLHHVTRHR